MPLFIMGVIFTKNKMEKTKQEKERIKKWIAEGFLIIYDKNKTMEQNLGIE
jgi:hypothetical protein